MTWISTKLTENQVPYIPEATVHTVGECYDTFVAPLLPALDVVQHWHELLLAYVAQPNAILFIRRYASARKTEYHLLRRGFLTLDPTGFGFAYCDNYFPQLIFAQVLAGNKPTLSDLNEAIHSRRFPVSVRLTRPEVARLTFGRTTAPPLGQRGWKLSHLYSVNQGYSFDYRGTAADIFPRGNYDWWGNADKIHRLPEPISPDSRRKMVAHFLRAVHPANYFLSPARSHQVTDSRDIGENPVLLAYVQQRFQAMYGGVLAELEPFLLVDVPISAEVMSGTDLQFTVRRPSKKDKAETGAGTPPTKTRKTASIKPYPITYSIGEEPAVKEQAFQALLRTGRAIITRHFQDGVASVATEWNADNMKATSSLTSNLRGRFRQAADKENIARLHVSVIPEN